MVARQWQERRFAERPRVTCTAQMGTCEIKQHCNLNASPLQTLKMAMNELKLSARAYDRTRKVSRTIAELAGAAHITAEHVGEAVQLRSPDRQIWG